LELAQGIRRAIGLREQIGSCHLAGARQGFDDRAQSNGARLELRQGVAPAQLGERPDDGLFAQRRAHAQRCRHRGGDDLADRMTIVICRPEQQLQESGVESRLIIDGCEDGSQLACGHVRPIAAPDDHADHAPPSEWNPDTLPRSESGRLRRRPVVEGPPQRRVDRDCEDHDAARSMHRSCGQACAWAGVKGPNWAIDGGISMLIIICTKCLATRRGCRRRSEEWRPLFYRILQNRIRDCQRRRRSKMRRRISTAAESRWAQLQERQRLREKWRR
jgi:hypothetical protein